MLAACREAGIVLAVNCGRRWRDGYLQAVAMIEDGLIGDLLHVQALGNCGISHNGSHLLTTMMMLAGSHVEWVMGEAELDPSEPDNEFEGAGLRGVCERRQGLFPDVYQRTQRMGFRRSPAHGGNDPVYRRRTGRRALGISATRPTVCAAERRRDACASAAVAPAQSRSQRRVRSHRLHRVGKSAGVQRRRRARGARVGHGHAKLARVGRSPGRATRWPTARGASFLTRFCWVIYRGAIARRKDQGG